MFLRENTENYFEKDQSLEKNMNVKKDSERKETLAEESDTSNSFRKILKLKKSPVIDIESTCVLSLNKALPASVVESSVLPTSNNERSQQQN